MNNKLKILINSIAFILTSLIVILLLYFELYTYALFMVCISFVSVIFLVINIFNSTNKSDNTINYNKKLSQILRTYDSILTKIEYVPELNNREIIVIDNIEDLVDAQNEIRKPICFRKRTNSCSFVLLDEKVAYVYILKESLEVKSELDDIIIKNREIYSQIKKDDRIILEEITSPTIVKIGEKAFLIKPIDDKNASENENINVINYNKN